MASIYLRGRLYRLRAGYARAPALSAQCGSATLNSGSGKQQLEPRRGAWIDSLLRVLFRLGLRRVARRVAVAHARLFAASRMDSQSGAGIDPGRCFIAA